jgi:hypothetical protein
MISERKNVHLVLEIDMLYTFGDSMTYGWNFYKECSEKERQSLTWPGILSQKLDMKLQNLSFPGASNWRAARIIQSLPLTEEDVVVVQWSGFDRIEMGVNPTYEYKSTMDIENKYKILDDTTEDYGVRTKNMCRTILPHTTDEYSKKFMFHVYNTFWNEKWHHEMFKVMLTSSLYALQKSKCKFIIFDGWMVHCDKNLFGDVLQYIVRGTTINSVVKEICGLPQSLEYPSFEEHKVISDIIYENLEKIYV